MLEEEDNEDEYSASACEIMQRRSSSRRQSRRKRRPSSPFSIEAEAMLRRRSSACTISSGELVTTSNSYYNWWKWSLRNEQFKKRKKLYLIDKIEKDVISTMLKWIRRWWTNMKLKSKKTLDGKCRRTAISMEESGSQERIFEKLKLHKEVLSGAKQQPWPLRRKIKLVRQAKSYVRRHEGVLQERLAQTRSTKDAIARVSLFATKVIIIRLEKDHPIDLISS